MDRDLPNAYEADFYAWTKTQAEALRRAGEARLNADVDWDHVAEEIEDLGRSERSAVESHLATVIEHLLKLMVSPAPLPRADWKVTVIRSRDQLHGKLTATLRNHLGDVLAGRYAVARRAALAALEPDGIVTADLPANSPWTLAQLLDEEFWPESRHGHG